MKKRILTIAMIAIVSLSFAQQDAQYSFYMFNNLYFNPAYAGKKEALHIEVLHREQWGFFNVGNKIEGAPQSTSLAIHAPFKRSNNALGFNFHSDIIGPFKNFDFGANYAYRIPIGNKLKLSFGVRGTYKLYNRENIFFLDGGDPTAQEWQDFPNINTFNVGGGIYLWNKKDKFYVGFSVPHLINNKLYHNQDIEINSNNAQQHRHYFATAGVVVGKPESNFKFYPSTMLKFVESSAARTPVDVDLNANFLFYNRLWIGAGYRFGGNLYANNNDLKFGKGSAVIGMMKVMIVENLEIGYAYDYTMSRLTPFQNGSHELLLNFNLNRKNNPIDGLRMTTPRYVNYF